MCIVDKIRFFKMCLTEAFLAIGIIFTVMTDQNSVILTHATKLVINVLILWRMELL